MPLTFNDGAQEALFSLHLQTLDAATTAKNAKAAHIAAMDGAFLLLKAPKTNDNEAEHQRLISVAKMQRSNL